MAANVKKNFDAAREAIDRDKPHMTSLRITVSTKLSKMVGLLMVSLLLLDCSQAAISQSPTTREVPQQPLRYRAIVSEPNACVGNSINLELELENTSSHRVLVDPGALLYSVTVSREGGAVTSRGDRLGTPNVDKLVALEPGQSYRKSISYPLTDKFFLKGLYSLRLTYGQFSDPELITSELYRGTVHSNTVLLEIKNCE